MAARRRAVVRTTKDGEELEGKLTDPFFAKYCKMLRLGIPFAAVVQKMVTEGVDAERIEQFRAACGSKVSDGAGEIGGAALRAKADLVAKAKADPRLAKYFKMIKLGVPLAATVQKMLADGAEADLVELLKAAEGLSSTSAEGVEDEATRARGGAAAKAAAAPRGASRAARRALERHPGGQDRRPLHLPPRLEAAPLGSARDLGRGAPAPARDLRRGRGRKPSARRASATGTRRPIPAPPRVAGVAGRGARKDTVGRR